MKKLISVASALACFVFSSYAYTERNILSSDSDVISRSLSSNQSWVKYPAYSDRTGWQKMAGEFKDQYIVNGEKYLNYSWPRIKATDYLGYQRTGNRRVMERPIENNTAALTALLMAELAEGKGRFMDQIVNGVYAMSEMTTWALSAHIPMIVQNSSLPAYDQPVIDLEAGEIAVLMSWIHYFLKDEFDKINPEIARRIKHEIKSRILDPYLSKNDWWWDPSRTYKKGAGLSNWTPWCESNILITAMLMEDDATRYHKLVKLASDGMDEYLNVSPDDGASQEGYTYWTNAAARVLDFADMINLATGGKVKVAEDKLIRNMGEFEARSYIGDGWVVNFSDASAKSGADPYLCYRFGKATNSDLMCAFGHKLSKENTLTAPDYGTAVFRTLQALEVVPELKSYKKSYQSPGNSWFPNSQICYLTTPQELFVASKGGHNNESHNHNDVGTFSVYADEYPIIIDAGISTYSGDSFGDDRYKGWNMTSGWHNLPVINGQEQMNGSTYRASDVKAGDNSFSLNIAGAYPKEAGVSNWTRTYTVNNRKLNIKDNFAIANPSVPNVVNFITWGTVDTSVPGTVSINANGHRAKMSYDSSRFEVSVENKKLDDNKLSAVWGSQISRISLKDKSTATTGTYDFTLEAL